MINTETITKEETNLYFKYLKEGKKEYRDKIIVGNYRLVIHIALKYNESEYELDDLVSTGVIGLIKAVDSFDIDKHINFSTYAGRCINNQILMLLRHKKNWISINDVFHQFKNGNVISIEDMISSEFDLEESVIEEIHLNRNLILLKKVLDNMDERKREVVLDYYGIGRPALTQVQIAEKHNVSKSFIYKIINKTLPDIKNWMNFEEEHNSIQKLLTKKEKNNKINM